MALCLGGARAAHAEEAWPEERDWLRPQRYELGGFIGLGFGGDFVQPGGKVDFEEGQAFAALLAIRIADSTFFGELMFSSRPSILTLHPSEGNGGGDPEVVANDDTAFDIGIQYYLLGATYRWYSPVKWLTPFIGAGVGATRVYAETSLIKDSWQFAWAPVAGAQFELHPNFSIRTQGRVLFTDIIEGEEIYCGAIENCESATRSVVSVQYDMYAGLVLKL